MAKYLSVEWIDDLNNTATTSRDVREACREHRLRVTQTVTGGPDGDVSYHLSIDAGGIRVEPGSAEHADLRFEQDYATAVGLATGALNAQTAFVSGRLRVTGDMDLLMASQPVFAALDAAFAEVRRRTEFV